MKIVTRLLAGCAAMLAVQAVPAAAILNVPVPAANYITVGSTDWAWAAPCAFQSPSCGVVDLTYQGSQGWRIPTRSEFLARPTVGQFSSKCASAWFSTQHTHCDFGDPTFGGGVNGSGQPMGYLYDFGYGITNFGSDGVAETWLVRGALGAVPEPSAWALLILGFGTIGAAMRGRRQSAKVGFA